MMKRFIAFYFYFPLLAAAAPTAWEGDYTLRKGEGQRDWSGFLQISDFKEKRCTFNYSVGSQQSVCEIDNEFEIVDETAGKQTQYYEQGDDKPALECVITLEKKSNGAIFVDAGPAGKACNDDCGSQGAIHFGVEMVPEKRSALKKGKSARKYETSFDCESTGLSEIESTICTIPDLAQKDRKLAKVYSAKLKAVQQKLKAEADALRSQQKQWFSQRNGICTKAASLEHCLTSRYDSRLKELGE